jgi:hypothetical protein
VYAHLFKSVKAEINFFLLLTSLIFLIFLLYLSSEIGKREEKLFFSLFIRLFQSILFKKAFFFLSLLI